MVKVSVIVPVYNVKKYLEKCLTSLVNQTLKEMELIVVNDGSTDGSDEIIKKYAEKYPQIKAYYKENGGLSDARNYGLQYACGEYVGYVDADDFVEKDMYELLYDKAKKENSHIVECNLYHTYPEREEAEIGKKFQNKKELLMFGRSIVWNKIYKRSWLQASGVTFPKGLIYEDVEFFAKLIPHVRVYSYVDAVSIHYVQRSSSIYNGSSARAMDMIRVLEHIYEYYRDNGYLEEYYQALEFLFARIILCSSFYRMCGITSRKKRKRILRMNYRKLTKTFPNWKKNPVLRRKNVKYAGYMRSVNCITYPVYSRILPIIIAFVRREKRRHGYQYYCSCI